jgi:hypothetical protein
MVEDTKPLNPLDFPAYVRSLRPSLPDSLPSYVDDELDKLSQALQVVVKAADANSTAKVEDERITRIEEDYALAARLFTIEADFTAANAATDAKITSEEIARASADEAISSKVDTVSAQLQSNISTVNAAVMSEQLARTTNDEALASRIDTVRADFQAGDNAVRALVSTEIFTRADADEALASRIDTVEAGYQTADATLSASITDETTARTNADSALASRTTTLESTVNNATSGNSALSARITSEASTRASADSAISSNVTTLTTTVSGHTSTLSTYGTSINGLQAKYGVTLDVNGYVTGFSQNNGGTSGEFTILADNFNVVMPGVAAVTPFSVDSGGVKINGNLMVSGSITSSAIAVGGVTTSNIASNAVTKFGAVELGTNTSIPTNTNATVLSVTVNKTLAESQMQIMCYLSLTSGDDFNNTITLRRNGTNMKLISLIQQYAGTNAAGGTVIMDLDTGLAAGSYTYDIIVTNVEPTTLTVGNGSILTVTEFLK